MNQTWVFAIATALLSSRLIAASTPTTDGAQTDRDCDSRSGPLLIADYLYWQVSQDNMNYALIAEDFQPGSGLNPGLIVPSLQKPHLASGFRVGLGYNMPYHLLSLSLDWTRFVTASSSSVSIKNQEGLVIATAVFGFLPDNGGNPAFGTEARSRWQIKMNMLELMVKRHFAIHENLSFYPQMGLMGGWIDQSQLIHYNNFFSGSFVVNASSKRTNDLAAIGPKVGIMGRWRLGKQFGLFGNLGCAALYGLLDVDSLTSINETTFSPVLNKLKMNQHRLFPTAQMQLGVDWAYCLSEWLMLHVAASYEIQYWWKQWQGLSNLDQVLITGTSVTGDLQLQGFTLHFGIDF